MVKIFAMDLQNDFNYTQLALEDDYEGEVTACFISAKANTGNRAAVLYLHGFVDYFFQEHVAEEFLHHDIDFYALDLRKYGRALFKGQHPNYCRDLSEYFEEIDLALSRIDERGASSIYLIGHSTGGLIASLYLLKGAQARKINGLILNSPFFRFNLPLHLRLVLPLLSRFMGAIRPYSNTPGVLPPVYPQSLHKDHYGEWDFNLEWKPIEGFPAYFRWLSAISKAHKVISNADDIEVPILVMFSEKSSLLKVYGPKACNTDIVLNVQDIKSVGAGLGPRTTLMEVSGAMHDLFLSTQLVRECAFAEMFAWIADIESTHIEN